MKTVKSLLTLLTRRWPPPEDCHHGINLLGDKLSVAIHIAGKMRVFLLDEEDLDKEAHKLADGIEKAWDAQCGAHEPR